MFWTRGSLGLPIDGALAHAYRSPSNASFRRPRTHLLSVRLDESPGVRPRTILGITVGSPHLTVGFV